MPALTAKSIYLVLTICFGPDDCQVWVPDRWESPPDKVVQTIAKCEQFALAAYANHPDLTDWQCLEEGAPLESSEWTGPNS